MHCFIWRNVAALDLLNNRTAEHIVLDVQRCVCVCVWSSAACTLSKVVEGGECFSGHPLPAESLPHRLSVLLLLSLFTNLATCSASSLAVLQRPVSVEQAFALQRQPVTPCCSTYNLMLHACVPVCVTVVPAQGEQGFKQQQAIQHPSLL